MSRGEELAKLIKEELPNHTQEPSKGEYTKAELEDLDFAHSHGIRVIPKEIVYSPIEQEKQLITDDAGIPLAEIPDTGNDTALKAFLASIYRSGAIGRPRSMKDDLATIKRLTEQQKSQD